MTRTLFPISLAAFGILALLGGLLVIEGPVLTYRRDSNVVTRTIISIPPLEKELPMRLVIEKLGIDTSFVSLGVDENNEIEIPETYTEVGWYKYGPTPGERGPAVVLGHVDSKAGPGVFFYLGQLLPGDEIEVERADGSTAIFEVEELGRYPREDFPTEGVYGNIDYAGLRLITCSGSYDKLQKRYDSNLIVYAALVGVKGEETEESVSEES